MGILLTCLFCCHVYPLPHCLCHHVLVLQESAVQTVNQLFQGVKFLERQLIPTYLNRILKNIFLKKIIIPVSASLA